MSLLLFCENDNSSIFLHFLFVVQHWWWDVTPPGSTLVRLPSVGINWTVHDIHQCWIPNQPLAKTLVPSHSCIFERIGWECTKRQLFHPAIQKAGWRYCHIVYIYPINPIYRNAQLADTYSKQSDLQYRSKFKVCMCTWSLWELNHDLGIVFLPTEPHIICETFALKSYFLYSDGADWIVEMNWGYGGVAKL